MLEVKEITKTIAQKPILSEVSFTSRPGSITGIIGRNGVGKTTLLRTIIGILLPERGEVLYQGENVFEKPEIKADFIFIPDSKNIMLNYTPLKFADIYSRVYPNFAKDIFMGWLEEFSLPVKEKVRYFSKGMKALFYLILAFSCRTAVVLLDEPTEGLDPIFKRKCLKLIVEEVAARNPLVLISSNRLEEMEAICDQVVLLKKGKVEEVADLMNFKECYKKLQVAYENGLPPEIINSPNVKILYSSGRVYTLLIEGDLALTTEKIRATGPLLMEELPLNLEDIFITKLGGEEHV